MPIYVGVSGGSGANPVLKTQSSSSPVGLNLKHDVYLITQTVVDNNYIDLSHTPVQNILLDANYGPMSMCSGEHYFLTGQRVILNFILTAEDLGNELCFLYLY